MTSEPKAPGAPAIYLYRQLDRDDQMMQERDYLRIKILTEEGRKHADVEIRFANIAGDVRDIKARTIRPDGSVVNFSGQIYDKTVVKARGFEFRAKTFTLPDVQVGSIIEYRYERVGNRFTVFDSDWILNEDLFTRHAKFSLKPSTLFASRIVGYRLPPGVALPARSKDGIVRLEVNDLSAFEIEDYMPPELELQSRVAFLYSREYAADADTYWKKTGKEMSDKCEDFLGKHKAVDQALAGIVSPGDPPEVKLQKLYAKVQSFRNITEEQTKTLEEVKRENLKVSESVDDVWKRGYGSGWQLDWLFLALARAAGMEAHPVRISLRDRTFFSPETVNSYLLSHDVVLVRVNGKDLYFDPGSPFTPYGLLPWPETDVKGLLLDKNGSSWITTPLPASEESRVLRTAMFKLDDEGALAGKLTVTYTGLQALMHRRKEDHEDEAARKKYLEEEVKGFVPAGIDLQLTNQPDWSSPSRELIAEFTLKVPGWASGAGSRALLPVGLFGGEEQHLFEHEKRAHPVYLEFPFQTVDDITIQLPLGWKINSLPAIQSSDIRFSSFEFIADTRNGAIHLSRTVNWKGILLPLGYYGVLHSFIQRVKAADEQQVILQPAGAHGGN